MYYLELFVDSPGQKKLLFQEMDDITFWVKKWHAGYLIQVSLSNYGPVVRRPRPKGM
jgi:hypothetical protein